MKNKSSKEKVKTNKIIVLIRIILIAIIICCLIYIFNWYFENKKNSDMLASITNNSVLDTYEIDISNENIISSENSNISNNESNTNSTKITAYKLDFNTLLKVNSATVGWLNVPGTSINYPVAQSSDNDFYLKHSFDKSKNKAGWIFADYRNTFDGTDKNIIIYGHNRMDTSMFATLKNTQKQNWLNNKNNHYITFTTPSRSTNI